MNIPINDLIETNIRQRGIGNTNQKKMGLCIKELDRIYGIREGSAGKVSKNLESNNFTPKTEDELLSSLGLGITRQTIQNYKRLTEMIPELEELVDTGIVTKTTALAKQRKVIVEYVRLCGFEHGEIGNGREKNSHNGNSTKMTLDEIAKQLGTSKTNLTRALSIERNLTDSMKELLDNAAHDITKCSLS